MGIRNFIQYLLGKRSELKDLGSNDALLAKVVLDIHRLKTAKVERCVDLYAINPVHPLDRDNSSTVLNQRTEILQQHKIRLLAAKRLDKNLLQELIPSVSAIKVVAVNDGEYIAFEGNGRLGALKNVFSKAEQIQIAVEEYQFNNPAKIIRRLNRVRKVNQLIS